ncbi:MAG TPA: DUF3037 domain-containing protein [Verrucomicrobiae bacterium]|nr:DUF3037 domain-containing protein [Verrucomicrobiae bacterium]
MNRTKGYFSLVQYCPDPARQEAANVGVVLFCPEAQFIRARTAGTISRIRRFFGQGVDGNRHLHGMMKALSSRLEIERSEFKSLDDFEKFVSSRANKIILTQPKPMLVTDPQSDLETLYSELVAEPAKLITQEASLSLRMLLDSVLADTALRPYLQKDLEFDIPTLSDKLNIPYAFQNGRFNLIQPVEFDQHKRGNVINAACKHAIEGSYIYKNPDPQFGPMQLYVVADFADATLDIAPKVATIFREYNVRMFTSDGLENLKREILLQGKPVSNP